MFVPYNGKKKWFWYRKFNNTSMQESNSSGINLLGEYRNTRRDYHNKTLFYFLLRNRDDNTISKCVESRSNNNSLSRLARPY